MEATASSKSTSWISKVAVDMSVLSPVKLGGSISRSESERAKQRLAVTADTKRGVSVDWPRGVRYSVDWGFEKMEGC